MESESIEVMMEDGEDGEIKEPFPAAVEEKQAEANLSESLGHTFTLLDEEKLKKRAERFGLGNDTPKVQLLTKEQMQSLYESLELPAEEIKSILEEATNVGGSHTVRFEAVHLRGTEDMSTQDVFDYFKGYAPASIEWINDYSCNVVWFEPWQAAHALLELSTRIIKAKPMAADGASTGGAPVDRSATSDTLEEMEELEDGKEPIDEAIDEEDAGVPAIPTPPGVWRLGLAHDKAQALLMRFATRQDRKIKGAERLSTYYKIYGNPNYGNMVGLISTSRKRRLRGIPDPDPVIPAEETDAKNPWGSLAEAWGASETEANWHQELEAKRLPGSGLPSALVRRLGHQPPRPSPSRSRDTASEDSDDESLSDQSSYSSSSSSSSENSNQGQSRKKRPRMRMYADEEEEKAKSANHHPKRRPDSAHKEQELDDFGSKLARLRTAPSRPVHSRLGPNVDASSVLMSGSSSSTTAAAAPALKGDLRRRLGSKDEAPRSRTQLSSMVLKVGGRITRHDDIVDDDDDDDEEGDSDEEIKPNPYVDLRSKLKSRLGAK